MLRARLTILHLERPASRQNVSLSKANYSYGLQIYIPELPSPSPQDTADPLPLPTAPLSSVLPLSSTGSQSLPLLLSPSPHSHPSPPLLLLPSLPLLSSSLSILSLSFLSRAVFPATLRGDTFLRRPVVGQRWTYHLPKGGQVTKPCPSWPRRTQVGKGRAGPLHDLGQATPPHQVPFLSLPRKEILITVLDVVRAVFQFPEGLRLSGTQGERMLIHSEPRLTLTS